MRLRVWMLAALAWTAMVADAGAAPLQVEMTWMSIANWYFRVGDTRIVMDGYVSRLPERLFVPSPVFPKDLYTYTSAPATVDTAAITRVREAMLGDARLDLLLAGHAHWDHSWDTPTWSRLTGAPMVGSQSACLQAQAQGVPASACRTVSGGEKITLGDGVTLRVVRWNHSGDGNNPVQHFAREIYRPPVPDPATGGLRAGVGEDYPNGGGNRAFLITVDRGEEHLSLFVNNSASAFDLERDIIVDGQSYGSPLGNLAAALKDAGLTSVDVWIGTGGAPVAQLVVPVLHPRTVLPNHWDGLFNPFWPGLPYPFKDEALRDYLAAQHVTLLPERQYFDRFVLTAEGVAPQSNHAVKAQLGFTDEQVFRQSLLDRVDLVASTSLGDDCGEGFVTNQAWQRLYAAGNRAVGN